MNYQTVQVGLAILGGLTLWTSTVAGLVWWLSRQFSTTRALVYSRSDMLSQKIDDHERLDEERFANLGLRMQRVEIFTDPDGKFIAPRGAQAV